MSNVIKTHGVSKRDLVHDEIERHVEEIRRVGVTVVPSLFSQEEMRYARSRLYEIYDQQVADVGGEDNLRLIDDANIVRTPLAYDPCFISIAKQPKVLAIAKTCLGDKISLSSQVGIINRHGVQDYQEGWHRELQYQHFTCSRSLAVQSLVAVDEFTADNGGTFFMHGSHLFENFPSDDFVRRWEVQYRAPAGSVVMFDALVYHRGATNRTSRDRLAINNLYTLPIIHQQIDLANMLGDGFSDDPEDRQLFGYVWNPAEDVRSWRDKKIKAKARP